MAESASAAATAATPEPDIKQEDEAAILGGLDFNFSPELASSKRPFDEIAATSETTEPKRAKSDAQTQEASFEDGLALLVQNALSNVGEMVDQFTSGNDVLENPSSDPMQIDTTMPLPELPAPRPKFAAEPLKYVRLANVHALGNLALSMLLILVQPPFEDTIRLVRGTDSEHKRSFHQLKISFEHVRQLYSAESVLTADQLDLKDDESKTFVELANLAQLGSWLVDGSPKALSSADDNFLALFQCQLSNLPPGMTELYLSIKTQRAIEFLVEKEPEKPSEQVIGEVFVTQGLEDVLKEQHGGGELSTADQSFVSSLQTRKETLEGEVKEQAEPAALREKHPAEDLLRSYLSYARSKLKSFTSLGNKLGVPIEIEDDDPEPEREPESQHLHEHEHENEHELHPAFEATGDADLDLDDLSSFFEKTASGLVQNALAGLTDETAARGNSGAAASAGGDTSAGAGNTEDKSDGAATSQSNGPKIDLMTDYKELEALVAESTSNYVKTTLHGLSPVPYQPTVPTSTAESMASHLPYLTQLQHHQAQNPYYTYTHSPPLPPHPTEHQQVPAPGETLPPNQTFSSAILYDKARQAALSKTSAHTRREGLHSTRRPWTQEEEKALMAGLDMVKGPHWSQILTLFGQNGTISDILRDRTQVQLKDKARNLKLFFLKTNSEMPYYLQAVTGELKTRAPTQAARKEAEERARLNSEEDQAKLQGIMALAGGLQHPPQRTPTPGAAKSAAAAGSAGNIAPKQGHGSSSAPSAQQDASNRNQNKAASPNKTMGQNKQTGQNGGHAPSIPRPTATPASQIRPGVQTNTQQLLHAVAQAHQRPQTQLPPQIPRPLGQQQAQQANMQPSRPSVPPQTAHTTTNGHNLTQPAADPALQQQSTAAAAKSSTPSASVPVMSTLSPSPYSIALPPQAQQQPPGPYVASAAPHTRNVDLANKTELPGQEEQDDNAAEAALLEGLQAVVAQT
ncbi:hypothetical protein E4U19_006772 [Claviceps sp. Clav32 group G5]|nr:hypothetical protein E4U19_006772 [Claviceps sp. Clav32 group G5]